MVNKRILYIGLAVLIIIAAAGFYIVNKNKQPVEVYTTPQPEEVVRQYFTAWNNKNYPDMYSTLSDGFKRIDYNAKDLNTFKNFASSQGIEGVNVIDIKEESNDGNTAVVAYTVEFILADGKKQEFNDKFSLKYRQGDIILGWKLIHPYGENIDTS